MNTENTLDCIGRSLLSLPVNKTIHIIYTLTSKIHTVHQFTNLAFCFIHYLIELNLTFS